MTTKRLSLSTTSKDVKVMKERGELEMEEVSGHYLGLFCWLNQELLLVELTQYHRMQAKQPQLYLRTLLAPDQSFLYNRFHYFAYVSSIKCLIYPEPILIPKPNLHGTKRNNSTMF